MKAVRAIAAGGKWQCRDMLDVSVQLVPDKAHAEVKPTELVYLQVSTVLEGIADRLQRCRRLECRVLFIRRRRQRYCSKRCGLARVDREAPSTPGVPGQAEHLVAPGWRHRAEVPSAPRACHALT